MVTVRLLGGLGNQMFQYAVGRAIAHRRGTSLALDVSAYPDHKQRRYSLGVFKIVENFASRRAPRPSLLRSWAQRWRLPAFTYLLVERKYFSFDPTVLDAPGNVYLDGYWQSERYFKEIEPVIRREFRWKEEPGPKNAEMANRIKAANAVAIHVRRGDYVHDPKTHELHGVCPPEYYREGARLIAAREPNPQFFVFSDDPEWVQANLELEGPTTYVNLNSIDTGYEDLRLMALCRHHIIANSSFSWWGAWLANSGGMVVAPQRWLRSKEYDIPDLIPEGWVRLENSDGTWRTASGKSHADR